MFDVDAENNNFLQIIKNKWGTLPEGIYFVNLDSNNGAIALIYKVGLFHGSIYIMSYVMPAPIYSRLLGGTWM